MNPTLPTLGIQSYCFRNFQPLSELIEKLKETGLSAVEIWPGHLGHGADSETIRNGLALFDQNGIEIASYGVCYIEPDEDKSRSVFEFAQEAGIAAISADLKPEAYKLADQLCEEYGIKLAVHNHGRKHHYGNFAQLDQLLDNTSENIGLCLDSAWLIDSGEDPVMALDRFRPRIYGIHLKDFRFDEDGNPVDVQVGTGGLNLYAFLFKAARLPNLAYLSLEYEGDPDNPLPKIKACVDAVKENLAKL